MVKNKIDTMSLDSLNLEELSGVVSIYPWFAGARVELCRRMAQIGGEESWGEDKYALISFCIWCIHIIRLLLNSMLLIKLANNVTNCVFR